MDHMKTVTLRGIIFAFLDIGAVRYLWKDERDALMTALVFREVTPDGDVQVTSHDVGLVSIADVLELLANLADEDQADLDTYGVTVEDLRAASKGIFDVLGT